MDVTAGDISGFDQPSKRYVLKSQSISAIQLYADFPVPNGCYWEILSATGTNVTRADSAYSIIFTEWPATSPYAISGCPPIASAANRPKNALDGVAMPLTLDEKMRIRIYCAGWQAGDTTIMSILYKEYQKEG